jgi:hypothetical protein
MKRDRIDAERETDRLHQIWERKRGADGRPSVAFDRFVMIVGAVDGNPDELLVTPLARGRRSEKRRWKSNGETSVISEAALVEERSLHHDPYGITLVSALLLPLWFPIVAAARLVNCRVVKIANGFALLRRARTPDGRPKALTGIFRFERPRTWTWTLWRLTLAP